VAPKNMKPTATHRKKEKQKIRKKGERKGKNIRDQNGDY
jgi:hypothetical protein